MFSKFLALTLTRVTALFVLLMGSAHAHLQLVYTPNLLLDRGGPITLKMPFTHPAENGTVMEIDSPEAFYVIKNGKKKDLMGTLKKTSWTSAANTGVSYEGDAVLRGLGDNVFVLRSAPYYEKEEDVYIQQIAKSIVNVGGLPTDWNSDFGLDAEIVPLTKPYALYEGNVFSAVVKANGEPVPFAEIEVEFVNYLPDMQADRFADQPLVDIPADAFITMTIYADANGTFHFGLSEAGQWGFAALGVGKKNEHNGKELSQDAVIWVQAHPVVLHQTDSGK